MANLISSQRYLDENTVAEKTAAADFDCSVSPVFVVDGVEYQILLDGHHSHAAAVRAGRPPVLVLATEQVNDRIALLRDGDIDGFLAACHGGDNYYSVSTGQDVW
jgi:hypothetical protein